MEEDRGGEEALWPRESKDLPIFTRSGPLPAFLQSFNALLQGTHHRSRLALGSGGQRAPNETHSLALPSSRSWQQSLLVFREGVLRQGVHKHLPLLWGSRGPPSLCCIGLGAVYGGVTLMAFLMATRGGTGLMCSRCTVLLVEWKGREQGRQREREQARERNTDRPGQLHTWRQRKQARMFIRSCC